MAQETYLFSGTNYPLWFSELEKQGRVTYKKDIDGKLLGVSIKTPAGMQEARIGDLIVYDRGSVCVIKSALMNEHRR